MSLSTNRRVSRWTLETAVLAALVAIGGVRLGHPAVTFVTSGALVVWLAILSGSSLARRLALEVDPGRQLMLSLLLAGAVLLALVGVGLLAAPLP